MKPYEAAQKVKMPESDDRRIKLTTARRKELVTCKGKMSQREAARKFNVSRRLVIFTWYPDRLQKAQEGFKQRRKDGRYKYTRYETREQWNARQWEIKNRKYAISKIPL